MTHPRDLSLLATCLLMLLAIVLQSLLPDSGFRGTNLLSEDCRVEESGTDLVLTIVRACVRPPFIVAEDIVLRGFVQLTSMVLSIRHARIPSIPILMGSPTNVSHQSQC